MANKEKLQQLINQSAPGMNGKGLEIGPGFDPVVPKRDGFKVETLDHLSAQDLRSKYQNNPSVDVSRIEDVDFVSDGGPMLSLIGKPGYYDYIVASHVIEHTVDVLGFLLDCQALLKPTGRLVLAVPDMRFSFDCLRPVSTTGQAIDLHHSRPTRHSIGRVFDELAYNCQRDGAIAWQKNADGQLQFFRPIADAKWISEQYQAGSMFLDIHAWQFTPSSFRLMIKDLGELELIGLKEESFELSNDNEFFVVLAQAAPGCTVDRMALAQMVLREHSEIKVAFLPD